MPKAMHITRTSAASKIRFSAMLLRPAATGNPRKVVSGWTFLTLPKQASAKLPSRGMVSVTGTLNGLPFRATLEPDGQGSHWLKVDRKVRAAWGAAEGLAASNMPQAGDVVTLEIVPLTPDQEPEPKVPADLRKALAAAPKGRGAQRGAQDVWSDLTPLARRDWIQWIVSAKQADTRARRIKAACDMLAKGKRRPCCFDRSGMYGRGLNCPAAQPLDAAADSRDTRR